MTFDLTFHTDAVALATIGAAVAIALFSIIGISIASKLSSITDELSGLPHAVDSATRTILRKDFSYKPKFDEENGGLKIGPGSYDYAPWRLFHS